jgi:glycerate 2-kinase
MKPAPGLFQTHSMRKHSWGAGVARILSCALAAVDPQDLVRSHLALRGQILQIGTTTFDLREYTQVIVLAVGKAALPMAQGTAEILGNHLSRGLVLTKKSQLQTSSSVPGPMEVFFGGHPVPDREGLRAAIRITDQLTGLTSRDLVMALVSGGGSALLTLPAGNISLKDLQQTNSVLLGCGADIQEINTIRKHLSQVKGGQLARLLEPARLVCLVLSDVIGDPLETIASGPTVPDPSTFKDAWAVVAKYNLEGLLPPSVRRHLQLGIQGQIPDTPKPGDPAFQQVTNLVIGNNTKAVQAGIQAAVQEGYHASTLPEILLGEASALGPVLAGHLVRLAVQNHLLPSPACLIGGGESTVSLPRQGEIGRGGRNLEIALSAVRALDGLENAALITLASDGEDGVTDAAGAVVTGESCRRARELGLEPDDFLRRHDSYRFFEKLDDLLKPGPTGTNVNDLCFLISTK